VSAGLSNPQPRRYLWQLLYRVYYPPVAIHWPYSAHLHPLLLFLRRLQPRQFSSRLGIGKQLGDSRTAIMPVLWLMSSSSFESRPTPETLPTAFSCCISALFADMPSIRALPLMSRPKPLHPRYPSALLYPLLHKLTADRAPCCCFAFDWTSEPTWAACGAGRVQRRMEQPCRD